jgi:uncharacterized membrane protein (UPF0127 family)
LIIKKLSRITSNTKIKAGSYKVMEINKLEGQALRIMRVLFCALPLLLIPNLYAESNFKKICIKNICIKAEIVDSAAARERGLMFRKGLKKDQGMFFIFKEQEIHAFWMKNMRFPLDIIWIDTDKRIVDIKENVPPCRQACGNVIPLAEARYVLEVNAGFIKRNVIKIGDKLDF